MRRILLVLFPDFQILDAAGPLGAFEVAERLAPGSYAVSLVAEQGGEVTSSCGAALIASDLSRAPAADTILVAGGSGVDRAVHAKRLLRFLQRRAARTRRIASICSGAFLLAQAGLLDGRPATTHWSRCAEFAARFPRVRLEPDRIFVRAGAIWSSAGVTAGIDLSLALIEADLGEEIARNVARYLVVYHRRAGGQSQYSALLDVAPPQGRFADLITYMREHLEARLSVDDLAAQAGMSVRQFARAFAAECGETPAKVVEKLRADAARAALESGAPSVKRVARESGFGDAERMRRAFLRVYGVAPSALKRA